MNKHNTIKFGKWINKSTWIVDDSIFRNNFHPFVKTGDEEATTIRRCWSSHSHAAARSELNSLLTSRKTENLRSSEM